MLPDIANRLSNLSKALETVIVPAIPDDNPFAKEQAALMLGHLAMLSEQWDAVYLYERGSLHNMTALARRLIACTDGLPASAALDRLAALLQDQPECLPLTASGLNAITKEVGTAVDQLIEVAFSEAGQHYRDCVTSQVLQYNRLQATRERIWFRRHGMDPDEKELGTLEEMLHTTKYLLDGDLS
ncbi:hypothetical protein NCG89_08925 [Spongiibacter taiwanensis]|uniref:hypothetical protein n=1 Tax=Spongiibacter taiwanensis TaxID=1748242 RepID=UPI0020356D2D|nr:hypothetical protein [Spongiibacter taiwanensis]USA41642.1 hypothetical protein NCG89_08925 [Spongiibacter taiwanensis]